MAGTLTIEVVIPRRRPRQWQRLVVERLRQAGHPVLLSCADAEEPWSALTERLLQFEHQVIGRKRYPRLASIAAPPPNLAPPVAPALRLDLTAAADRSNLPSLTVAFDGRPSAGAALDALACGRLPGLAAILDGEKVLSQAAPMVDNRFLVAAGLEDVLARAVTLLLGAVARFEAGATAAECQATMGRDRASPPLFPRYPLAALPRLVREMLRRKRFRFAHWRVGYRLVDGDGVAETGRLGGGWNVLADDGERFYADPFPFVWQGRNFIFVEDYSHAAGKAVISVAELGEDGSAALPVEVIAELHHLSYPQVFARDGCIWLLPESSGGHELVLYRAENFPRRWVRHAVLFAGRELSDATLVEHGGSLWLFATDRDGHGSTSDTLVVFSAARLEGPWIPHPMNPIAIDRTAARPGGAATLVNGRLLLPLQDGTQRYGGGLGLAEIIELTHTTVRLGRPVPIDTAGDFPYPQIHTLNRSGALEVIDGIAAVRK